MVRGIPEGVSEKALVTCLYNASHSCSMYTEVKKFSLPLLLKPVGVANIISQLMQL